MAIFLVLARTEPEKVQAKIHLVYPGENIEFSSTSWFVYDTLTTQEVAEKLQMTKGEVGAEGIVLSAAVWTGYGPSAVWEWLAVRRARENNPVA
jgi:hypothetical protein